jgi:hypothetical protein
MSNTHKTTYNSTISHRGGHRRLPPQPISSDEFQRLLALLLNALLERVRVQSEKHGVEPLPIMPARLERDVFVKACEDCRGMIPENARDLFDTLIASTLASGRLTLNKL